jgi:hypothetical protein
MAQVGDVSLRGNSISAIEVAFHKTAGHTGPMGRPTGHKGWW